MVKIILEVEKIRMVNKNVLKSFLMVKNILEIERICMSNKNAIMRMVNKICITCRPYLNGKQKHIKRFEWQTK